MKVWTFLFFCLIMVSCKKDTIDISSSKSQAPPPSQSSTSYLPMAVGNYWVYQRYNVDTGGVETLVNPLDSIYISKDTSIGSHLYYYFRQSDTTATYLFPYVNDVVRDSAGAIVSAFGHQKYFYPSALGDTIRIDTTTYNVAFYFAMENFTNDVVPAGTFSGMASNIYERYLSSPPKSVPFPVGYTHFAQGVGIVVQKNGFVSTPKSGYKWKLLRYHV